MRYLISGILLLLFLIWWAVRSIRRWWNESLYAPADMSRKFAEIEDEIEAAEKRRVKEASQSKEVKEQETKGP